MELIQKTLNCRQLHADVLNMCYASVLLAL